MRSRWLYGAAAIAAAAATLWVGPEAVAAAIAAVAAMAVLDARALIWAADLRVKVRRGSDPPPGKDPPNGKP